MDLLAAAFSGSVLQNLSKKCLSGIEIPIPKSAAKIQKWVDKISTPYTEKFEKQTQIKELETFIQNRIKEIVENEVSVMK